MDITSGKRKYFLIPMLIILLIFIGVLCIKQLAFLKLESTDLSGLTINGFLLNQNINNLDLSSYHKNSSFDDRSTKTKHYKYFENFMLVYNNEGKIIKLQTLSDDGIRNFSEGDIVTLQDAVNKFGHHYVVKSYDSSQGLSSRIYYDKVSRIKATFIYPKNGGENPKIVWASLEAYH
ncbi:peptidase M56 [Paenibacillus timonensis]|nr:peptidase M56 [Paenibacillus timonensis]MUG87699.1 peptidase M56 [Paenibacillus timonensis]